MVKITLEYTSIDDAITAMALLRGSKLATDPSLVIPAKDTASPKPDGAKAKGKTADAAPTATAAPAAAPATQPVESSPPAGPSYDVVAAAISAAAKTHRSETVAVLAKFGAKTGKDLKPEQYAEFSAALAEATKPSEDLA